MPFLTIRNELNPKFFSLNSIVNSYSPSDSGSICNWFRWLSTEHGIRGQILGEVRRHKSVDGVKY